MIEILMATYNGAAFVGQQIESIVAQTNQDWHLTICDDGSKDETMEVLARYAEQLPDKISYTENAVNSGSAGANFMGMLMRADADYVMFADQDDVWLPTKVETTLRAMQRMEEQYGSSTPLLVHTDLTVVDGELRVLHPSMMELQKLKGSGRSFEKQLVQNCVTGCTIMMNRALVEKARRSPEHVIMHDWWVSLVASCFGRIGFVRTPLIWYRQHGSNVEGVKDFSSLSATAQMAKQSEKIRRSLQLTYEQARAFGEVYEEELSSEQRTVLNRYCELERMNGIQRVATVLRHGYMKTGWNRKAGHLLYLLMGGNAE